MKKMMVCLVILGFVISGCTGSFGVTKKIYEVHRTQDNKWVDEVVFLAFVIIPVYAIGMLADGFIFNTIEFWTGENSFALNDSQGRELILERSAEGVVAKDKTGSVLYTSIKDTEGGVSVFDGDYTLVQYFSPEEVQAERSQLSFN